MSGSKNIAMSKVGMFPEVQSQHYTDFFGKYLQEGGIWVGFGDLKLGLPWDYEQPVDGQDAESVRLGTV